MSLICLGSRNSMQRRPAPLSVIVRVLGIVLSTFALLAASPSQRPLEIRDIPSWKVINQPVLSNDGRWFGYRISPLVGDTEVVVRETQGEKEFRFSGGDFKGA